MADIIGALLHGFWDVIGYHVLRAAIPIASFGKARIESPDENITADQRWNEVRRDHDGKIVINGLAGAVLFWVLVVLVAIVAIIFYESNLTA